MSLLSKLGVNKGKEKDKEKEKEKAKENGAKDQPDAEGSGDAGAAGEKKGELWNHLGRRDAQTEAEAFLRAIQGTRVAPSAASSSPVRIRLKGKRCTQRQGVSRAISNSYLPFAS